LPASLEHVSVRLCPFGDPALASLASLARLRLCRFAWCKSLTGDGFAQLSRQLSERRNSDASSSSSSQPAPELTVECCEGVTAEDLTPLRQLGWRTLFIPPPIAS